VYILSTILVACQLKLPGRMSPPSHKAMAGSFRFDLHQKCENWWSVVEEVWNYFAFSLKFPPVL